MEAVIADVEAKMAHARLGGGPKALERMTSKGKKLPRERCAVQFLPVLVCVDRGTSACISC